MYDLDGRVALVTGAGGKRGLGRAIARRLAQEGADIIVNDVAAAGTFSRPAGAPDWAGLPDVVSEIRLIGRRALGVVADVSDARQVESMIGQAVEHFGRIDILVNNAGAPAGQDRVPVVSLDEDAWDLVQRVNVKGTFLCCRAVAPVIIAGGRGGRIINMSSIAGKRGVAHYGAYCASKFAVRGLTQVLALELASHRITVNAICPGWIETERVDDMAVALAAHEGVRDEYRRQMLARVAEETPLGRTGRVEDVAQMAAYLASDQANYLTGLSINVAGGSLMD
jgi:NAD(P)-dependent dehydrogenase (short-subunit alcohol dehydrogenase family)